MPQWIADQYGQAALNQWEAVYNSCQDKGGDNCGAQATGAVQNTHGKALARKAQLHGLAKIAARKAIARRMARKGFAMKDSYGFKQFDDGLAIWLTVQDPKVWNVIKSCSYIYDFKLGWLILDGYFKNFQQELESAGLYPDPTWDDALSNRPKVIFFYT